MSIWIYISNQNSFVKLTSYSSFADHQTVRFKAFNQTLYHTGVCAYQRMDERQLNFHAHEYSAEQSMVVKSELEIWNPNNVRPASMLVVEHQLVKIGDRLDDFVNTRDWQYLTIIELSMRKTHLKSFY